MMMIVMVVAMMIIDTIKIRSPTMLRKGSRTADSARKKKTRQRVHGVGIFTRSDRSGHEMVALGDE